MQANFDPTATFDTTAAAVMFPILHRKLGDYKPLRVELSFKDININFHQNLDKDITSNYTMTVDILVTESYGTGSVFSVELPMTTTFKAYTYDNVFFL